VGLHVPLFRGEMAGGVFLHFLDDLHDDGIGLAFLHGAVQAIDHVHQLFMLVVDFPDIHRKTIVPFEKGHAEPPCDSSFQKVQQVV
jgi:hypothetical protein